MFLDRNEDLFEYLEISDDDSNKPLEFGAYSTEEEIIINLSTETKKEC
jgi:hypothetical protein